MVLGQDTLTDSREAVITELQTFFTYFAIGEGSTAETAEDTGLVKETLRKAIAEVDTSQTGKVIFSGNVSASEANGTDISEDMFVDAAANTVDACDATSGWTDSADMTISLNQTTYHENAKSLNLAKDGTGSATASTSKTTSSVDFTSKNLHLWLYIIDAAMLAKLATTDCVTIRFGSDSSNYYQWTVDAADLAVGWNYLGAFTSSNADSTTGSPTITACDYTYVGITATGAAITWSAGDLIMDDIKLLSGTLRSRNTPTTITKTSDINVYIDVTVTVEVTQA